MGQLLIQAVGFGIGYGAIIAIGAMGFSIQFGLTNIFNLSYGGIMTVAAFSLLWVNGWGLNPWLSLPFASVIGVALTLTIGKIIFPFYVRRGAKRVFEMAIISVALLLIIEYGAEAISHDSIYSVGFNQGRNIQVGDMIWRGQGVNATSSASFSTGII